MVGRHRAAPVIRRCARARSTTVRRPAVTSTIAGRSAVAAARGRCVISTTVRRPVVASTIAGRSAVVAARGWRTISAATIARRTPIVPARSRRTISTALIAAHPVIAARGTNWTRGPRHAGAREVARSAHPRIASRRDIRAVAATEACRRAGHRALPISERRSLVSRRGRESATRFTGAAAHRRTRNIASDLRIAHPVACYRALRHSGRGPGSFAVAAHRVIHRTARRPVCRAHSTGERLVPGSRRNLAEAARGRRLAEAMR